MTQEIDFIPEPMAKLLLPEPSIHRTPHTVQVYIIRQTHDYSIFRTEETRELNVTVLPKSMTDRKPTVRVAMLASKQKAPESREYLTLIRGGVGSSPKLTDDQRNCELKDNLCMRCPRCILFGAVSTEAGGRRARWNIKHRIEYSTAYSLEPWEEIAEITTFNAVSSVTQSTGQALGYVESVSPLANFPSIVTLNSVTREELIAYMKTLMVCKSYGAETRTKGDVVNIIVGLTAGYEELVTPLEFNLELSERAEVCRSDPIKAAFEIAKKYRDYAAFEDRVAILTPKEVESMLEGVRKFEFTADFVGKLYRDAVKFVDSVEGWAKKKEG